MDRIISSKTPPGLSALTEGHLDCAPYPPSDLFLNLTRKRSTWRNSVRRPLSRENKQWPLGGGRGPWAGGRGPGGGVACAALAGEAMAACRVSEGGKGGCDSPYELCVLLLESPGLWCPVCKAQRDVPFFADRLATGPNGKCLQTLVTRQTLHPWERGYLCLRRCTAIPVGAIKQRTQKEAEV